MGRLEHYQEPDGVRMRAAARVSLAQRCDSRSMTQSSTPDTEGRRGGYEAGGWGLPVVGASSGEQPLCNMVLSVHSRRVLRSGWSHALKASITGKRHCRAEQPQFSRSVSSRLFGRSGMHVGQ